MTRVPTLALIVLLALIGCGGTEPPSAPTPPPVPSTSTRPAPPVDGGRYDSPGEVVAAMEKAGLACTGYEPIPGAVNALERGNCHIDGNEVAVSTYATTADAQGAPNYTHELLRGVLDVDMVVGGNWTALCQSATVCAHIADRLGGKVVHIPA